MVHQQVPETMTSLQPELFGYLVPLQGTALLLPRSAISGQQRMDAMSMTTDGPVWLLGSMTWNDREAPVVSLEAMSGASVPPRKQRSRLTVIQSLGNHLDHGLFVAVTQGFPRLVPVNPPPLHKLPALSEDRDLALTRVRLASAEAIIPDLDAIEARIEAAISAASDAAAAAGDWVPDADDAPYNEP